MTHKRSPDKIIAEILVLLDELRSSGMTGSASTGGNATSRKVQNLQRFTGPSGGVKLLISEGFFKEPKTLPEVCERLRQEGFNYAQQAVSVAMLRLVRDRTMVRLPAKGDGREKWVYAERK